jgi:hypothetical protein
MFKAIDPAHPTGWAVHHDEFVHVYSPVAG